MAKAKAHYSCQSCGAVTSKWAGKCEACGEWNTIVEEAPSLTTAIPKGQDRKGGKKLNFVGLTGENQNYPRVISGMTEFDRAVGGGLVPASVTLIGGDPGIGKSTLLLQVMAAISKSTTCLYISGEESIDQIRLRAARLGVAAAPVQLVAANGMRDILSTLETIPKNSVVVIDSIQTMYLDTLDSAPGTVAQVRAASAEFIRVAKAVGFSVILVGHVTKEGTIAGPKVLEHMVDTVLYFEGDRGHQFRILRTVKNRFGATDEIGVFEMSSQGLAEVTNPSSLFLSDRSKDVSGAAVFAGIEGTRPILVEIQALLAQVPYGTPRRTTVGWDTNRLAMILAVLDSRCGLSLANHEVYLNIAGGMRVSEPAVDLAVAAAIISAKFDKIIPGNTCLFGEVSLSGEIRPVSQMEARLKEAKKLGFTRAIIPKGMKAQAPEGLKILAISELRELIEALG